MENFFLLSKVKGQENSHRYDLLDFCKELNTVVCRMNSKEVNMRNSEIKKSKNNEMHQVGGC